MRNLLLIITVTLLVLTGCGRKEPPQPIVNDAPPSITEISHSISGNTLKIELKLAGGSYGIGIQVDRAEIDPHCNCPGFWRRYVESSPRAKNYEAPSLTKFINLRGGDLEYAFRIRAVDALGRFGEWSKTIRARSQLEFE